MGIRADPGVRASPLLFTHVGAGVGETPAQMYGSVRKGGGRTLAYNLQQLLYQVRCERGALCQFPVAA